MNRFPPYVLLIIRDGGVGDRAGPCRLFATRVEAGAAGVGWLELVSDIHTRIKGHFDSPVCGFVYDPGAYPAHHQLASQMDQRWKARLRGYNGSTGHMTDYTAATVSSA